MTNYKVFCADCHGSWEQSGKRPVICGICGSDFIAVKAINVADGLDVDVEDESYGSGPPPYDAATATGMYDHY